MTNHQLLMYEAKKESFNMFHFFVNQKIFGILVM